MKLSIGQVASLFAVLTGLGAFSCGVASAQSSVSVKIVLRLRGPIDGADLDRNGAIARSTRGQYVVSVDNGTRVGIFDSTGRPVRVIGRAGDGPGEFRRISGLRYGPGDTLLVLEASRRLVHVLSPSLSFVRRVVVPVATNEVLLLKNGSLAVGGLLKDSPTSGRPLHLATPGGAVSSIGDTVALTGPSAPPASRWLVAYGTAERFWSVPMNAISLREWSVTGAPAGEVTLSAPWFEPWQSEPALPFDEIRPPSRISDLVIDVTTATVLVTTPSATWRPSSKPLSQSNTAVARIPLSYFDQYLDSRVAIFDLRRRRLIAAASQTDRFTKLLGPMLAASLHEDENGMAEYRVWSLSVP